MRIGNAVLLVGSAKPSGTSTSESLGRYLLGQLESRGVTTSTTFVSRSKAAEERRQLSEALAAADLFILATPLYVDSLPYLVTRSLESIAASRARTRPSRSCAFAAVVNCGFPESHQCDTAIAIARAFARRARFEWAGGLALGEGGAIDGRRLEDLGRLGRNVRAALDASGAALAEGLPIPAEAIARMGRPLMPPAIYTVVGNSGWKRQARRNGVRSCLTARPYE